MKLINHFRDWLSRPRALALFLFLGLTLWVLQAWMQQSKKQIVHTLGSSTHYVDLIWLTDADIFNPISVTDNGRAYTMPLAQDKLIAIDIKSGALIWEIELPFEQRDARSLLANENTVFLITGVSVNAYKTTTGEIEWSTILGDGHVSIVSQLDSVGLRVYYGDTLFEIDLKTGKIISMSPKNDVIWVSNEVALKVTPTHQLTGVNIQTNELLWTNDNVPYVREDYKPQLIGEDYLVIGFVKGICLLNLKTGEYDWCRPEIDLTKLAIDNESHLGFAMRDDLVLMTIDLHNGDVLGETIFLSSESINEKIGFLSSISFSDSVLIVAFSDSGQIFGLNFKSIR